MSCLPFVKHQEGAAKTTGETGVWIESLNVVFGEGWSLFLTTFQTPRPYNSSHRQRLFPEPAF